MIKYIVVIALFIAVFSTWMYSRKNFQRMEESIMQMDTLNKVLQINNQQLRRKNTLLENQVQGLQHLDTVVSNLQTQLDNVEEENDSLQSILNTYERIIYERSDLDNRNP